jgi:hypothetical protein
VYGAHRRLGLQRSGRGDEGDLDDIRYLIETAQVDRDALRDAVEHALVPDVLREIFIATKPLLLDLLSAR